VAHCSGLPASTNVSYVKTGAMVTIRFKATTCVAGASSVGGSFTLATIPARINPAVSGTFINFPWIIENNGAAAVGIVQFNSAGPTWTIFGTAAGGNFGTSGLQGWNSDIVLTYPTI